MTLHSNPCVQFQRFSLDVDVLHGSRCSSQPGIQPVPLNLWSMERLNTNPIDELDSVAFKMKFFGQPGICLVNFTLQSQSTEKASSFVEILGKRVEKETESDESENAAAVVNHHLALLPVLSKLKPGTINFFVIRRNEKRDMYFRVYRKASI